MKLCWIPALTAAAIGVSWPCMASPVAAAAAPSFEINRDRSDYTLDPRICPALKNYLNPNCTASKCGLGPSSKARRDVRIVPAPWVELPTDRAKLAAIAIFMNRVGHQKDRAPLKPDEAWQRIASRDVRLFHLRVPPKRQWDPSHPMTAPCPLRDLVMEVTYWRGKEASSLEIADPRLTRAGDWRYEAKVFAMEPTLSQTQACRGSPTAELNYIAADWSASLMVGATLFAVIGDDSIYPPSGEVQGAEKRSSRLNQFVEMAGADGTICYFDR